MDLIGVDFSTFPSCLMAGVDVYLHACMLNDLLCESLFGVTANSVSHDGSFAENGNGEWDEAANPGRRTLLSLR